jgi:hypothetical protein
VGRLLAGLTSTAGRNEGTALASARIGDLGRDKAGKFAQPHGAAAGSSALQGGQIDCGAWSPIDATVNASCDVIQCCRRETGQPATTNWAAVEAIDLPCFCPGTSGLLHNYLAQIQLPPGPVFEVERTTSACP